MGHGIPPIQEALDHGIRPSLSTDVETQMPADFFTQMRSVFTLQRMLALARQRAGERIRPSCSPLRDVVEFRDDRRRKDNASGTEGRNADSR